MSDVTNKRVVIYIDQAVAEDALARLQVKADGFSSKIQKARDEQGKLLQKIKETAAAGGDVSSLEKRYQELGIKINGYGKSLKDVGDSQLKLKQQIDAGMNPSISQMQRYVESLRKELKNFIGTQEEMAAKSEVYKKAAADLRKYEDAMLGASRTQRSWLQDVKGIALGVTIGSTVQAVIQNIGGWFSDLFSRNAKLSDSLAKVQQTTGLAATEVVNLDNQLKKLDTRTAQSELQKIAEIGGQFGVAKEDLKGFVEQIDRANVVLGSEFTGGAEQITTELALLRNVFTDIKTTRIDQDLGNIGNALVTLAQEGAATAPIVTDFAKRLSPLISTAKLTSGEILGLGATLQELAVNPERGGTAVVKLFDKMISNAEAFAKVAGLGVKEFKAQLRDNPFESFLKVLEGFKKGGDDVVGLNAVIQDLETSGVGAKEVLVKLSQNIDLLSNRSDLATEALTKTDRITQQFTTNNETLGAVQDKIAKRISSWFTNSTLTSVFKVLATDFYEMIAPAKTATEKAEELGEALRNTQQKLEPAINTYEELSKKTTRSKEENEKLKESFDTIASVMPTSITQFDRYGNAIEISTTKAREFLGIQRLLFQKENAKAIEEQTKEFDRLSAAVDNNLSMLEKGKKLFDFHYGTSAVRTVEVPLKNEDVSRIQSDLKSINDQLTATLAKGLELNGLPIQYAAKLPEILKKIDAIEFGFGQQQANRLRQLLREFKVDELFKELNISADVAAPDKKDPGTKTVTGDSTDKKEQKKQDDLLKRIKEFQFELEQVGKKGDEAEIDRITHKYEKIIVEATAHGLKVIELEKAKNTAIAYLLDEQERKMRDRLSKAGKEIDERDYRESLDAVTESGEQLKEAKLKAYADQLIDKKQFDAAVRQIDLDTLNFQIAIAQSFADGSVASLKQAATDLVQFKKKKNKEEINDKIKSNEELDAEAKRKIQSDRAYQLKAAELQVQRTDPLSNARLKAQLNLLNVQEQQELTATKLTEEAKDLIKEEYRIRRAELEKEHFVRQVQEIHDYVSTALSIADQFNQAQNNKEKAQLDKELKANDAKRKSIESLAKGQVITEQEKRKRLAALDADDEKKKEELEKKQQERSKRIAIAQAIINGAMAITSTIASAPGPLDLLSLGVARYAQIAFTIATTAAQIKTISNTKYEKGGIAGIAKGPSHRDGGIDMINSQTGEKVGEMQGGEPYMILSDKTYQNNRTVVDSLLYSSMYRNGASIRPQWESRPYRALDYSTATRSVNKVRFYENGGTFISGSQATDRNTPAAPTVIVESDAEMKQLLSAVLARLSMPLEVWHKKMKDAENLEATILNEASFR